MTPENFCYWLQGKIEIDGEPTALTVEQVRVIANHLNLVFVHSIDTPDPTGKLQATHSGKKLLTEDDKKELEKKISSVEKVAEAAKFKNHPLARC